MRADQREKVRDAIADAVGVTWEGCHKIYVLLDEAQVQLCAGYGYTVRRRGDFTDDDHLVDTLAEWFDESCSLRFVTACRSIPGVDPAVDSEFIRVIEQFDDEDEEGVCDTCGATYLVSSRDGRCGDCGECSEHCPHDGGEG